MKYLMIGLLMSTNAMAFGDMNFGGWTFDTDKEISVSAPGWVRHVRQGGGTRVNNGTKALFRNITEGDGGQRSLCNTSKIDNMRNITDMFPLIKNIPGIELRHVYFEKGMCATTISIKRTILNRLEQISLKQLEK